MFFKRLPKTGRKKGPRDQNIDEKVLALIHKHNTMSVRELAKKARSMSMVKKKKKQRHKTYKKQKVPKKSLRQVEVGKTRVRKLYDRLLNDAVQCVIMDETYVKLDSKTLPGPEFYTKVKGGTVDEAVSTIQVDKFGEKVLIWQAICICGLRTSAFFTKGTINADVYMKECLKKRLIPFYEKHNVLRIFWPDLASAHYARSTLALLDSKGINFVSKEENPPNCPELRPIERYWALVKRNLKKDGSLSENMQGMKKKLDACNP